MQPQAKAKAVGIPGGLQAQVSGVSTPKLHLLKSPPAQVPLLLCSSIGGCQGIEGGPLFSSHTNLILLRRSPYANPQKKALAIF